MLVARPILEIMHVSCVTFHPEPADPGGKLCAMKLQLLQTWKILFVKNGVRNVGTP